MTADVELLPLPEWQGDFMTESEFREEAHAYARACVEAATVTLRAEVEDYSRRAVHEAERACAAEVKAERLAEALREMLLDAPGGHSCEEFHHHKSDRHMPGDDCPAQLRWVKAVTTAQAALRDQEEGK